MDHSKYPISLTGIVFYWEGERYFELFEDGRRVEMSKENFESRSAEYNSAGTPFMIIDDKQINLLLQVWSQAPRKIDTQRLHFYRDFGVINKLQYTHYANLKNRFLS